MEGIVAQADDDRAEAEYKQAEARVGEIRATIERKTIRAPFGGLLGIRQVNRGQYLNAGSPVVALQSLDPIYVNFSVPQQDAIAEVKPGVKVHLALEGVANAEFTGQHHRRRLGRGREHAQRPGAGHGARTRWARCARACSCRRRWCSRPSSAHVAVPASAINYAPYGDSVFVVGEVQGPNGQKYPGSSSSSSSSAGARGDQVAVLSGLKAGEEVVTSGVFKLRNGAAVQRQQRRAARQRPRAEARRTTEIEDHRPLRQAARPGRSSSTW